MALEQEELPDEQEADLWTHLDSFLNLKRRDESDNMMTYNRRTDVLFQNMLVKHEIDRI